MTSQPSPTDRAAWDAWRRENPDVLVDLQGADLRRANLRRANLRGANLQGANLQRADLQGADLRGANLSGANLWGANLQGANLQGADLLVADLSGANLWGANLWGANLQRADLSGANLWGANLSGTRLDWNSHDLISAILSRAVGDDYDRRALAGSILVSRDWCWREWAALPLWTQRPDLLAWARETLAPYVRREDMAAEVYAFVTGQEVQS